MSPDAWDVSISSGLVIDEGCFGNKESPRDARSLRIILFDNWMRDVFCINTHTSERRQNNAVLEGHETYLSRLKERWFGWHLSGRRDSDHRGTSGEFLDNLSTGSLLFILEPKFQVALMRRSTEAWDVISYDKKCN